MTTIRPMTADDFAASLDLWATAEGVHVSKGDSVAELTLFLARNPGCSQVALRDGILVGAVLAGHDGRRGYLYHLAIAAEARGLGLGKALVDESVAALRRAGAPRVLILVANDNDAGFAFWRRCGWEDMPYAAPMCFDT